MRRFFAFLMAVSLCISLSACKSKEVKTADALISDIGEVTLDSKEKIEAAEAAVDALDEYYYDQVEQLDKLEEARSTYNELVKEKQVSDVIAAIDAIGPVTLESKNKIKEARQSYTAVKKELRDQITNYSVLVEAEQELGKLKVSQAIELIAGIGTVSLDSKDKIAQARSAYDSLKDTERAEVSNANTLTEAESTYEKLEQQAAEQAEAAEAARQQAILGKLTTKVDKVENTTWYHHSSEPYYANTRSYVLPYIGKNASSTWLRLEFHYTGDDWVFFTSITVSVDGQNYNKSFDFWEVDRDNGSGDVWEWVDIAPSNEDIEMLKAIANSNETIVRFQGDTYHYDLTVKASDKTAISDVLAAYDILK